MSNKTEIGRYGTEADHVKRVTGRGGRSYKFKSPMRRNVPDRLDLLGMNNAARTLVSIVEHHGGKLELCEAHKWVRQIVADAVQFTECKAPGRKPNKGQVREHRRLRDMGYKVNVFDG